MEVHHPWDSPGKITGVGCHFLLQCMKVKSESEVAQSCPTPSDPMDCSPPGSSVHGILQARVLEWGAIALSLILLCISALSVVTCPFSFLILLIWFFSFFIDESGLRFVNSVYLLKYSFINFYYCFFHFFLLGSLISFLLLIFGFLFFFLFFCCFRCKVWCFSFSWGRIVLL